VAIMNPIEEGTELRLDFTKLRGLASMDVIPVAVQEKDSGKVLLIGFVNELALKKTMQTGLVTFWSTSRNELWVKGDTSGNRLRLVEARVNCEQNSILFIVTIEGQGACHTKGSAGYRFSCFYRRLEDSHLSFEEDP